MWRCWRYRLFGTHYVQCFAITFEIKDWLSVNLILYNIDILVSLLHMEFFTSILLQILVIFQT